jgi:hypothetical protein
MSYYIVLTPVNLTINFQQRTIRPLLLALIRTLVFLVDEAGPEPSVMELKFVKYVVPLFVVIPAQAGIQMSLYFLDSGSRVLLPPRLE